MRKIVVAEDIGAEDFSKLTVVAGNTNGLEFVGGVGNCVNPVLCEGKECIWPIDTGEGAHSRVKDGGIEVRD